MIELTDSCEKTIVTANEIRDELVANLPLVIESPTVPHLNEEERAKVVEKLVWLVNNEYRARFYYSMAIVAALRPGTPDNPTRLTPLVMKWAGIRKLPEYKEPTQKIGEAKNGRVLRSGKSL
jgi:hypothetical protein